MSSNSDGRSRVWSSANGQLLSELKQQVGGFSVAAISQSGKYALTVGIAPGVRGRVARIWNTSDWTVRTRLGAQAGNVLAAAISPDDTWAVTGGSDRVARIWDLASGRQLGAVLPHKAAIHAVAIRPDGGVLICGCADGSARLWRVATHEPINSLFAAHSQVEFVGFSPNGRLAITAGYDREVKLWDSATGQLTGRIPAPNSFCQSVAVSPNGRFIVAGGFERSIRIHSLEDSEPIGRPLQHQDVIRAVAFTGDGQTVVTASSDSTAKRWHVPTGIQIGPPFRHQRKLRLVVGSPDGRLIATGDWGGSVALWEAPAAITGSPSALQHWVERITGIEIDGAGSLRVVGAAMACRFWRQMNSTSLRLFACKRSRRHNTISALLPPPPITTFTHPEPPLSRPKARAQLRLVECEDRTLLDAVPITPPPDSPPPQTPPPGSPPLAVDDLANYQILQPSTPVGVLGNDLDGNPGATWDFTSLAVVNAPTHGIVTLDPTNGQFLYTPDYLLPPGLPPGSPPPPGQQDAFTYHVKNSLGMQSNTATVTVWPIGGLKEGYIIAHPDIGFTKTEQPTVIDLLANDELKYIGRQFDYASVTFNTDPETNAPYPLALPQHGAVTFDPTTGAATYTPDFGYVGWDRFEYQVSTTVGGPDEPFPGEFFTSEDEVYVIVSADVPRLQADPNGGQMLVVDGTEGDDVIRIVPGDRGREVKAVVNGVTSPSFRPTSRILVFGYGGNDSITVDPRVSYQAWLVGGQGNDTLKAGSGQALLMGNEGDDILTGGPSHDLLIGGEAPIPCPAVSAPTFWLAARPSSTRSRTL